MPSRIAVIVGLVIGIVGSAAYGADKRAVKVTPINDQPINNLNLAPSLVTADTCVVTFNQDYAWRIDGWVFGFELYKSLMDPASSCDNAYPFTITAINMLIAVDQPTPITVAVDVEAIDSTTIPGCPIPGVLLTASSQWEHQIDGAGIWSITVPLDTPLVVNGPFFAGFYIGNTFNEGVNPAVLADSFPVACATYNIWDTDVGWVDLGNSEDYNFPENFPGRLMMKTIGTPSGLAPPQLEILTPADGDVLYSNQELWAWDAQITGQADYIVFEYSNGGPFVEIGRDFDGTSPLRDGVGPTMVGTGFSLNWNFTSLAEGNYDLRVTMVDTLGGNWSDTINVYLEPTPPVVTITSPANRSIFCLPTDIDMTSSDENLSAVQVFHHQAEMFVSLGGSPLDQSLVGEFGYYYSAPVAAVVAARIWSDRGYPDLLRSGSTAMTSVEAAEEFAAAFKTRSTRGTYDEAVFSGLKQHAATRGNGFEFDIKRQPTYADLRIWVENNERVAILGLGGYPGLWVTIDGFSAWQRNDSSWLVDIANPMSGALESAAWRDLAGHSEIMIGTNWHRVDLMISMFATGWSVDRTIIGADVISADGWSTNWNQQGVPANTYHYLQSVGHDLDDNRGLHTVFVKHDCAAAFEPGDFDNDRTATITDLLRLIEYIAQDGPPPNGGAMRADCNCDNIVNVADIIYYMNFLYGTASPPCR